MVGSTNNARQSIDDAIENNVATYKGTVCKHHPNLKGLRYHVSRINGGYSCVGCQREKVRKWAAEEYARRKILREELGTPHFIGDICRKHKSLNGLRYILNNYCVECVKESTQRRKERKKALSKTKFRDLMSKRHGRKPRRVPESAFARQG